MKKKIRIALYSRKSKYTDKGDSVGNQIELIKEYIKNIFILYGAVFVLEFVAQIYFVIVSNITNYEDSGIFDDTILSVISIAIIGLNSVIILMSYLVIKKNIKGKRL